MIVHENLVAFTKSSLIYKLGIGMIGVFLPLILLNEGLPLWQMCMFYVGYGLSKLAINYPSFHIINRKGPITGLTIGYLIATVYLFLITGYIATHNLLFLYTSAFMLATMNSFLWNSQHLHISAAMDETRKSRDLATISNLGRIVGIISPILGGLIAVKFGSGWLASIAAIICLFAISPILKVTKQSYKHQPLDDLKYSIKHAPVRDLVANAAFNAHTMVGVMVWPIYLAVFIPSFTKIGYIDAISTAVAVVVLQVTAKRSDKGKSFKVLTEGTLMSSMVHVGRIAASSNPFTITFISSLYDIALSYQVNPWVSIYYAHAKKRGFRYILSMEIIGDLTYVLIWGLFGALAYFADTRTFFTTAFAMAAIVAWFVLFITKDPLHYKQSQA